MENPTLRKVVYWKGKSGQNKELKTEAEVVARPPRPMCTYVCCFNNMHLLPFQEYNFKQTVDTSGLASSVNANAGQIFAMSFSPSVSSSSTYEPCENIGLLTTPTTIMKLGSCGNGVHAGTRLSLNDDDD